MGLQRVRPSHEILSGDSADVYFSRAESILEQEGLDPLVSMEVFARQDAVLCGIGEAKNLLGHVLAQADPSETRLEALDDGDRIAPKEVVLRIRARYRRFGLYETAFLGMLAQSTGWATAARECVDAAAPEPVISFGARHIHPDITDVLDYAAIVGGCVGASTPAGARLAGLAPTGTMPHSLVLIFGDTVEAVPRVRPARRPGGPADRARRHVQGRGRGGAARGPRARRPALRRPPRHAVGARPGHRGPRQGGPGAARPGRLQPRQDRGLGRAAARTASRYFKEAGAPVDSYAVGSYISGATPIDFTGDIKEIDGQPIAKRGRIPGLTDSPRLRTVDLAAYREG